MLRVRIGENARVLIGLYVPAMVMSLGQGMVVPTIPTLASTFEVSTGVAAQLVTAGLLGRALALLPAGVLIDRWGRRPALIGGPLIIAGGSALTALAPVFGLLLAAQFLTGLGGSLWQIAREVAAIDVVRVEQRGRVLSGFFGMHSVGVAVGPLVGGGLTAGFGFRSVFWAYAAMSLLTLAFSLRIRETARARRADGRPWLDLGGLTEVEPYFRPTYVVLVMNTFVAMMRGTLITSMVPLYVGIQLGYSSVEIGALFSIYGLVNVLMIGPTGFLSDTRGRKAVVMPSTFLATAVFLAFPLASTMPQLSTLIALTGVATGLALGTMATYTYDVIPEPARARLQTSRRLVGEAGAILGPALGGAVADLGGASASFWAFVPLQLASALLITFVARESLHRAREASGAPAEAHRPT